MEQEKRYAIDDFIDQIKARKDDRGFLSRLKRGLSEGTESQAWGLLPPFVDLTDSVKRRIWLTTGGIVAILVVENLLTDQRATVGTVLRKIMNENGKAEESRTKTYEAKLRRLMNCSSSAELSSMLVALVRMAASKGILVNGRQLYFDLNGWDDSERKEQTRLHWAQDFYRVSKDGMKEDAND